MGRPDPWQAVEAFELRAVRFGRRGHRGDSKPGQAVHLPADQLRGGVGRTLRDSPQRAPAQLPQPPPAFTQAQARLAVAARDNVYDVEQQPKDGAAWLGPYENLRRAVV